MTRTIVNVILVVNMAMKVVITKVGRHEWNHDDFLLGSPRWLLMLVHLFSTMSLESLLRYNHITFFHFFVYICIQFCIF